MRAACINNLRCVLVLCEMARSNNSPQCPAFRPSMRRTVDGKFVHIAAPGAHALVLAQRPHISSWGNLVLSVMPHTDDWTLSRSRCNPPWRNTCYDNVTSTNAEWRCYVHVTLRLKAAIRYVVASRVHPSRITSRYPGCREWTSFPAGASANCRCARASADQSSTQWHRPGPDHRAGPRPWLRSGRSPALDPWRI